MEVDPQPFLAMCSASKESILLTYKKTMDFDGFHSADATPVTSPSDVTLTVRASLVGNVMLLYDVESIPMAGYPSRAIVLERCVAQLEDPTPILPYPFVIIQYNKKYWFSCFGEDDRADWVRAIVACSYEIVRTGLARFQEQIVERQMCNKYCRLAHFQEPGFQPATRCPAEQLCTVCRDGDGRRRFQLLYSSEICRPFNVPEAEPPIVWYEHMAEPKATLAVPEQFLQCTGKFWSFLLDQLASVDYLPKDLDARRMIHVQALGDCLAKLKESVQFVSGFHGSPFKSSICKEIATLAFIPTNLHLQSITCGDGESGVDYFTCGAFTAYSEGYDQGGLRSMMSNLSENTVPSGLFDCDLKRVSSRLRSMSSTAASLETCRPRLEEAFQGSDLAAVLEQCRQLVANAKKLHSSIIGQFAANAGEKFSVLSEQLSCWFEKARPKDDSDMSAPVVRVQSFQVHRDDIDAEIASLHTKVENVAHCCQDGVSNEGEMLVGLHQSAQALLVRLDSLHMTNVHGYLLEMLNCLVTKEAVNTFYKLFYRYSVVLSQALSAVVAVLLNTLWLADDKLFALRTSLWSRCGALVSIHSFLSCLFTERFMLEDMIEITSLLRSRCKFRLVSSAPDSKSVSPIVEGDLGAIKVTLHVPEHRWEGVPEALKQGEWFQVHVVLWNVGVNHEQTLSIKFQEAGLEVQINEGAGVLMERYCISACRLQQFDNETQIKESLSLLRNLNKPEQWRNVEMMHQAMKLTRLLAGDVILCCKSGKDRTSMAVTYDEALFVQRLYNVSCEGTAALADCLRKQGTRMENAYKNLGARRYAFKRRQVPMLPACYRPPEGLYASLMT